MDAYSGYNQIRMSPDDEEKIAFITDWGLYCYKAMPFGLKHAGATYQRLVNRMFKNQIGRNMEVYVDDLRVKSKKSEQHLDDLQEAFVVLRKYKMKLNPQKCAFGVELGKFLGFMVSRNGRHAPGQALTGLRCGLSCRSGGGVGVHIIISLGEKLDYALKLGFKVTNNEAEYEALLSGLTISRSLGAIEVEVKADSQIVVGQILRGENQEVDRLAKTTLGHEEVSLLDHVVIRTIDVAAVGIRVSAIEVLQPPA
ncbi:uncharacterized protein K02A2.6-like [Juglans microcarpa x Juglans regia]|uniref:uncharacterized protein K02A2.6-like n=1 Tax=Juglans microcarpa x Juglans regia TaxID=2249226 RepID=UPI001B7E77BD|nr:uncharacterized protein K02A2.6-like [Juglans microcarpa x Juglans regia]